MGRPTTLDKPNSAGWLCKHIVIILVDQEYSFFFVGPQTSLDTVDSVNGAKNALNLA